MCEGFSELDGCVLTRNWGLALCSPIMPGKLNLWTLSLDPYGAKLQIRTLKIVY